MAGTSSNLKSISYLPESNSSRRKKRVVRDRLPSKGDEDTDDASEGEEAEQRCRAREDMIKFYKNELLELQAEIHPKFVGPILQLRRECEIRREENRIQRTMGVALVEAQYAEEMEAIREEYRNKMQKIQDSIVDDIKKQRDELQLSPSTRKNLRRRENSTVEATPQLPNRDKRIPAYKGRSALDETEIENDLIEIVKDASNKNSSFPSVTTS